MKKSGLLNLDCVFDGNTLRIDRPFFIYGYKMYSKNQKEFDSIINIDDEECNCYQNQWEWDEDCYCYECFECGTCFILPFIGE